MPVCAKCGAEVPARHSVCEKCKLIARKRYESMRWGCAPRHGNAGAEPPFIGKAAIDRRIRLGNYEEAVAVGADIPYDSRWDGK